MKAGIITFQETNNYGALWQNYALQKALEKQGVQAETIDYRPQYISRPYRLVHMKEKGPAGYLFGVAGYACYQFRSKGNREFRRGIRYSRPVGYGGLESLNDAYGVFIAGSDQVWNPSLTGYDDAYCLGFVRDSRKKTSYAASLGLSDFKEKDRQWYMHALAGYREISVREESAGRALSAILGRDVETVLDPVFLLSAGEWRQAFPGRRIVREKYILVYQIGISRKLVSFAEKCRKRHQCRLVFLPFPLLGLAAGSCKFTAGAGEALNYIYHAEYVITDSFHGMAMSVIFQKKFTVLAEGMHSRVNARILDFLDLAGLGERAWDMRFEMDREIDWDSVRRILKKERARSCRYLRRVTGYGAD